MGSKAEYVQRFTKGQRVLVIGRLEISEWQTREGESRTSYDIWADDVVNLSPHEDGARGQGEPATSSAPNGVWRGRALIWQVSFSVTVCEVTSCGLDCGHWALVWD
jgi:single-stranded DNA-binding protein